MSCPLRLNADVRPSLRRNCLKYFLELEEWRADAVLCWSGVKGKFIHCFSGSDVIVTLHLMSVLSSHHITSQPYYHHCSSSNNIIIQFPYTETILSFSHSFYWDNNTRNVDSRKTKTRDTTHPAIFGNSLMEFFFKYFSKNYTKFEWNGIVCSVFMSVGRDALEDNT